MAAAAGDDNAGWDVGGGDASGVPSTASERQDGAREPLMERGTVDIYERNAAAWRDRRPPRFRDDAAAFAAACAPGALRLDVGSGPGTYFADLGRPLVAIDAAFAMVALARQTTPEVPCVQA